MKKKKILKKDLIKKQKRQEKREYRKKLKDCILFIIRRDNNQCQMCKKDLTNFKRHPAHILPNTHKYKSLSTEPNNLVLLCAYCHIYSPNALHNNPLLFYEWLKKYKREQFDFLIGKVNLEMMGFN